MNEDTPNAAESTPQQDNGQQNTGNNFQIQELPNIDPPESTPQEPQPEEQQYALSFDPELGVDPSFGEYMTSSAQQSGLPADKLSAYINNVVGEMARREQAAQEKALLDLRTEWGADFSKRAKATYEFTLKLCESVGLSENDARYLSSPAGYRLMYALSRSFNEQTAAGTASPTMSMNAEERRAMAEDMRRNPQNPYYRALNMPSVPDSERRIAFKKFNELYGRQIYPE